MKEQIDKLDIEEITETVNFNIPGQEEMLVRVPILNDLIEEDDLNLSITPHSVAIETVEEQRRIWSISMLHQDIRQSNASETLFGTCGGNILMVHRLDTSLSHQMSLEPLQRYEDECESEDFYTLCWGVWQRSTAVLAVAGKNSNISIIDAAQGKFIRKLIGHKNEINELKFQPSDGAYLLSCSNDFTIRLWNAMKQFTIAIFHGPTGHFAPVLSIDWHNDEIIFLSAGMDSTVKLWTTYGINRGDDWDPEIEHVNGFPCAKKPFNTSLVYRPSFSTGKVHRTFVDCARFFGNLIVSKAQESVIAVWKAEPRWEDDSVIILFIIQIPTSLTEIKVKFSINYKHNFIAIGGENNVVRIFKVNHTEGYIETLLEGGDPSIVRGLGFAHDDSCIVGVNDLCYIYVSRIEYDEGSSNN